MVESVTQSALQQATLFLWYNNFSRSLTMCGSHSPTHTLCHQLFDLRPHQFPLGSHRCRGRKEHLVLGILKWEPCTVLISVDQRHPDILLSIEISSRSLLGHAEGQRSWKSLSQSAYSNWQCPRKTVRPSPFRAPATH